MADKKKQEMTLTESGYQFDRDLAKVSVKVSPELQAVIANQHDLIDLVEKNHPEARIFIEQHRTELLTVEEQIANSFIQHRKKRETAKAQRQMKKEGGLEAPGFPGEGAVKPKRAGVGRAEGDGEYTDYDYDMKLPADEIEVLARGISPGLPSQRYSDVQAPGRGPGPADVRRVAVGASIRALSGILGRELTEEEIAAIERQVDSYL